MFWVGSITVAERKRAQGGAPVYMYLLTYPSDWLIPGTGPGRFEVARAMSALFTSFARTSQPVASGLPQWEPYTTETRATLQIDAESKVVNDPYGRERLMWTSLGT